MGIFIPWIAAQSGNALDVNIEIKENVMTVFVNRIRAEYLKKKARRELVGGMLIFIGFISLTGFLEYLAK